MNNKVKTFISKHLLSIGVCLFIISIAMGMLCYTENKVGLQSSSDITIKEYIDSIDGLGDSAYEILIENKHIENMYELRNQSGINEVRYKTINKYFKVGDNFLRRDVYIICLITTSLLMLISTGIIVAVVLLKHITNLYNRIVIGGKITEAVINGSKIKKGEKEGYIVQLEWLS